MITQINVNWHTSTGKWHSGDKVMVELPVQSIPELKQQIVDNQIFMAGNWVDSGYYVHVNTSDAQDDDPEFCYFAAFLFMPEDFKGMRRT